MVITRAWHSSILSVLMMAMHNCSPLSTPLLLLLLVVLLDARFTTR